MFAPDGEKCFGFLCGLKYLFSLCIGNDFVFGTVDDEFGEVFFYTGIRFREWDMDLFPCWEVFLNLQQEVRLLWRLPEGQLFRECVSPIRRHGSLR